jgi:hypothetical protein
MDEEMTRRQTLSRCPLIQSALAQKTPGINDGKSNDFFQPVFSSS